MELIVLNELECEEIENVIGAGGILKQFPQL